MYDAIARFTIDNIPCSVHAFGLPSAGALTPLFVMPVAGEAYDLLDGQHMRLDPAINEGLAPPFALAVFETPDWNNALSPWPAPPIKRGQEGFGGGARATLDWIQTRLLPAAEARLPAVRGTERALLGYSMGGLFALWAIYQTGVFTACASCSGSLWYDGFIDYMKNNTPSAPCSVYLSLGDMEEKTRNPMFSRVGDATRCAAALMAASPLVKTTTLIWHPGGHTGAVGERLAAAQLWLSRHV